MLSSRASRSRALRVEQPVVVMARGHSGTRVLARSLELLGARMGITAAKPSQDVFDGRLARAIKRLARQTLHRPPEARPEPRDLDLFRRRVASYLRSLGDGPGPWGWKLPETYMIPGVVVATFPHARLIHMIRDGRDVAFRYHRTDRPDQRLGHRLLAHIGALDEPHPVQAALSWAFQVERFDRFAEAWPGSVHAVSFEALCARPIEEMEGVAGFLGIPMTRRCADYLASEVDPDKVAEHELRDPLLIRRIEAAIGPVLRAHGYETGEQAAGHAVRDAAGARAP